MSQISVNAHLANRQTLDLAVQAGCRGVRIDGVWPMIQPDRGTFLWTLLDESVFGAVERHLEVLVTLNGVPAWANRGQGWNGLPILLSDWTTFVHAVCTRYRQQIAVLEIFNEANIAGCWAGTAEQYVSMLLHPAAEVVRRIAPEMRIAGPAVSTEGPWRPWLETVLRLGGNDLQIVTVHAYAKDGHAVWQALSQPPRWWEIWRRPSVQQVIQASGAAQLPVWVTETGFNTGKVSEAHQAEYYDQLLEGWQTQPWIEQLFAYQLIDEPAPVHWGLFREDRSPKPVIQIIQQRQWTRREEV